MLAPLEGTRSPFVRDAKREAHFWSRVNRARGRTACWLSDYPLNASGRPTVTSPAAVSYRGISVLACGRHPAEPHRSLNPSPAVPAARRSCPVKEPLRQPM